MSGTDIAFTEHAAGAARYILEDGTTVRIRTVLIKAKKRVDAGGNVSYDLTPGTLVDIEPLAAAKGKSIQPTADTLQ